MPKKRGSTRASKRVAAKVPSKAKGGRAFQVASNLVLVAVLFTLINAALVFIFPNIIVNIAATKGVEMSRTTWIAMAVIWVLLAALTYLNNKMIQNFGDRHQMWGLLILGLLTGVATRLESALLIVVAAVTYLMASRKK